MKVVIIANGPNFEPSTARYYLQSCDRMICADGGTRHLLSMNLIPDIVVGDLDSFNPHQKDDLEAQGVRFEIHPTDKDETDLELALQLAVTEGATKIYILGIMGGRLDQSLANLLLLARPEWASIPIRAIVGNEVAWIVQGGQSTQIEGQPGDTVSLIPLSPCVQGVSITGVRWPLDQVELRFGSTWTMSNILSAPTAHLEIKKGMVLVIHQTHSHNSNRDI